MAHTIYYGTSETLFSCQSTDASIALYGMDVNMLLLWHENDKTTHSYNDTIRGTGSGSDSHHQGALWCGIRQRCHSSRLTGNAPSNQTAVPSTPTPNKEWAFIPALERTGLSALITVINGGLKSTIPFYVTLRIVL